MDVMRSAELKTLALAAGFDFAGIAAAAPAPEYAWYSEWLNRGFSADMLYLSDRRGDMRSDPRNLLPSARSVLCVAKRYNGAQNESAPPCDASICSYARGDDYHDVIRAGLERVAAQLPACEWKICVDTAPLLERAHARRAGIGWIGRNSCVIREDAGSFFFLGELLISIPFEPDAPPPDRCGSCTRCIRACPTGAIVPTGREAPAWTVDSRLCISYLTIENRGATPEALRPAIGPHVFGCDICQDVCPWNFRMRSRKIPAAEPAFTARIPAAPPLEELAALDEAGFRTVFRGTPVMRARYTGFLRNLAIAMGNAAVGIAADGFAALARFRAPLERLAAHADPLVREHAAWALARLRDNQDRS